MVIKVAEELLAVTGCDRGPLTSSFILPIAKCYL